MRRGWRWAVAAALCIAAGCARHAPAPKAKPAAAAQRPLPAWAPRNPSPEFMRAWRVLKPSPDYGARDPERVALVKRRERTYAAAYELFGTLTDEQLKRFLAERAVRVPVKSLSEKQRAALDRWFASWHREMKGQTSVPDDWLALLYKLGAQPDLSNVDVGFDAQFEGRRVHTKFWVRTPGRQDAEVVTDFANL